jgi:hypothetical protein
MEWYIVVKTIKGRRYYYRQKTRREGKRVRTLSQYIGPVDNGVPRPAALPAEPSPPDRTPKLGEPDFDQAHVDTGFELVMGKQAEGWEHHWAAKLRGVNLVVKDERIEATLRALGISWTHHTEGAYFRPSNREVDSAGTVLHGEERSGCNPILLHRPLSRSGALDQSTH